MQKRQLGKSGLASLGARTRLHGDELWRTARLPTSRR